MNRTLGLLLLSCSLGLAQVEPQHLKWAVAPFLQARYLWGGQSAAALDCSAFTQGVYLRLGVKLPRTALQQYLALPAATAPLQAGDLLFFWAAGRPVDHVAVYLGQGWMIHASSRWGKVVIEPARNYQSRYLGARRVFMPLAFH